MARIARFLVTWSRKNSASRISRPTTMTDSEETGLPGITLLAT
jgi:hypothetical protein